MARERLRVRMRELSNEGAIGNRLLRNVELAYVPTNASTLPDAALHVVAYGLTRRYQVELEGRLPAGVRATTWCTAPSSFALTQVWIIATAARLPSGWTSPRYVQRCTGTRSSGTRPISSGHL